MILEKLLYSLTNKFKVNHLYPFGIELVCIRKEYTLLDIDTNVLNNLIKQYKIVVFKNLNVISKSLLIQYAENIGPLLAWDFGVVMEMKAHEQPKNYLFTNGPVPFHWDGAFHQEPRYLLFHCVEAPAKACGGETLFANTNRIWMEASEQEKNEWLSKKIQYKTEKLAHYGGVIHVPLVQRHPDTKETILRFAEAVPKTMLNPVDVIIDGLSLEEGDEWLNRMADRCYQKQYCYEHVWEDNDILLADNFSLIHARRAFKQFSPRFLQRIQIL